MGFYCNSEDGAGKAVNATLALAIRRMFFSATFRPIAYREFPNLTSLDVQGLFAVMLVWPKPVRIRCTFPPKLQPYRIVASLGSKTKLFGAIFIRSFKPRFVLGMAATQNSPFVAYKVLERPVGVLFSPSQAFYTPGAMS